MPSKSHTGASVKAIILSILAHGDSYGYDIIRRVRTLSGGHVEWAAGSLYPVLHRMKTEGWIEDYWVEKEGERRRRFYRITKIGLQALEREKQNWMNVHGILEKLWNLEPSITER